MTTISPTDHQWDKIQTMARWFKAQQEGLTDQMQFRKYGPAGTGKTECLKWGIEEMGYMPSSPKVGAGALSGKAALRMRQKGLHQAATFHSQMYIPIEKAAERENSIKENILRLRYKRDFENGGAAIDAVIKEQEAALQAISSGRETLDFVMDPESPLHDVDVIVGDEASMLGGKTQRDLESIGKPIVYVGDHFQLSPVEKGASVMYDANGRLIAPDVELTEIRRQALDNPIIWASMRLREQTMVERGNYDGKLLVVNPENVSTEHLTRADQIIAGFNSTRTEINDEVRRALGRTSLFPEAGDKLICLKNNALEGLYNGLMGEAMSAARMHGADKGMSFKLDFRDEGTRMHSALDVLAAYFRDPGNAEAIRMLPGWAKKKYTHFDYGYCITCHKAQGSEWQRVLTFIENFGRGNVREWFRWVYTALTRAQEVAVLAY